MTSLSACVDVFSPPHLCHFPAAVERTRWTGFCPPLGPHAEKAPLRTANQNLLCCVREHAPSTQQAGLPGMMSMEHSPRRPSSSVWWWFLNRQNVPFYCSSRCTPTVSDNVRNTLKNTETRLSKNVDVQGCVAAAPQGKPQSPIRLLRLWTCRGLCCCLWILFTRSGGKNQWKKFISTLGSKNLNVAPVCFVGFISRGADSGSKQRLQLWSSRGIWLRAAGRHPAEAEAGQEREDPRVWFHHTQKAERLGECCSLLSLYSSHVEATLNAQV